jgi:hypothetical protein
MKKIFCFPALELFHCLPPLFHCQPLWKTVRLHGKKATKCNKNLYLDRRLGLLDRRLVLFALACSLFLSVSLRSVVVFGQFFVTCPDSVQFRHFPNLLPSSIFSGDLDFLCFGLLDRSDFFSEDLDLFLVFAGSGSPVGSSGVFNFL